MLQVLKKELGEDDDVIFGTLNALSVALSQQSRFAEAEDISNVLVAINTRKHGKEHPTTLLNCANLAACLFRRDVERVEEILREVLEIRQRILGEYHPDTI